MTLTLLTTTGQAATVDGTVRAVSSSMLPGSFYLFSTTADCWIRQGSAFLLTCVAKANLVDGDFITITFDGVAKVYEFDVTGNGVVVGRVAVNVSADTSAAQVAARLVTAIAANQAALEITNPGDGTLTLVRPDQVATISENVGNVGFTVGAATMTASAGNKSTLVSAGRRVELNGTSGPQLAVVQNGTSTGNACLTRGVKT